jgi:hypothetical protein
VAGSTGKEKLMDRETALQLLERFNRDDCDEEYSHIRADEILCELLTSLGYEDVVEAFKKIKKWYA